MPWRQPAIFISYRRDDTAVHARTIRDELEAAFGASHVFRDVDEIQPGDRFDPILQDRVAQCDVLLALIGPDWLTLADDQGRPRIQAEHDYVRYEIATALRTGKRVIPVLLDGARMPTPAQLPPGLEDLPAHTPFVLADRELSEGADRLIDALRRRRATEILTDLMKRRWANALAIGLSAFAYAAARRYASDRRFAFGAWKIEVLAAFASAVFLLCIAALMAAGSVERLFSPQEIHYREAMAVTALGLLVNLGCALILGGHAHGHGHDHAHHHHGHDHHHDHGHGHHHDINLRAAYLHVLSDLLGSIGAIGASIVMWLTGWWAADPIIAAVVGLLILGSAVRIVRQATDILLEATPAHIVTIVRDPYDAFVSRYYWTQKRMPRDQEKAERRPRHRMVGKPLDDPEVLVVGVDRPALLLRHPERCEPVDAGADRGEVPRVGGGHHDVRRGHRIGEHFDDRRLDQLEGLVHRRDR